MNRDDLQEKTVNQLKLFIKDIKDTGYDIKLSGTKKELIDSIIKYQSCKKSDCSKIKSKPIKSKPSKPIIKPKLAMKSKIRFYPIAMDDMGRIVLNSCSRRETEWTGSHKIGEPSAFGTIYLGCCESDCSFVIKYIPFKSMNEQSIRNEVTIQKIMARTGLTIPVVDSWFTEDAGIIIMPLLRETLQNYLATHTIEENKIINGNACHPSHAPNIANSLKSPYPMPSFLVIQ